MPTATTEPKARPFIKWAGGKQTLVEELAEYFPATFNTYYEPFLGGGSVFFSLLPDRAVLSDANPWLVETYAAVKKDWKEVASFLDNLLNTREEFLRIRSVCPSTVSHAQRAAHFIYLNKTCFRGLFRVNRQGRFNVPYGNYQRRYYCPDELRAVASALRSVELRQGDFELSMHDVRAGDFVYLDPPYYKLGGFSDFNRYTSVQFRERDHIRLAAYLRELDQRNIRWAVSNSNTPFIISLFSSFHIHRIAARREINLDPGKRNITELLITNY